MGRPSPTEGFPARMDREKAALFLGVSVRTLEDYRKLGRLPVGSVYALPSASKSNAQPIYRYDRAKLQAWLERCAQ